jgi:hypothetical protein
MRVLLRVAAALLIAIPVLITLVILFALAGRRGAAPSLESERSRSLERGVSGGSPFPARAVSRERAAGIVPDSLA